MFFRLINKAINDRINNITIMGLFCLLVICFAQETKACNNDELQSEQWGLGNRFDSYDSHTISDCSEAQQSFPKLSLKRVDSMQSDDSSWYTIVESAVEFRKSPSSINFQSINTDHANAGRNLFSTHLYSNTPLPWNVGLGNEISQSFIKPNIEPLRKRKYQGAEEVTETEDQQLFSRFRPSADQGPFMPSNQSNTFGLIIVPSCESVKDCYDMDDCDANTCNECNDYDAHKYDPYYYDSEAMESDIDYGCYVSVEIPLKYQMF